MKLVDEPYSKPALQFFDVYKGTKAAGELIATFELIELDYSGYLEVMDFEEDAHGSQHSGENSKGCRAGCMGLTKGFPVEIQLAIN